MWDITAIGDIAVDLIMVNPAGEPRPGTETLVEDARVALGGSTALLAAAAARLGLRVRLVGKVGDDLFGQFLLGALTQAGVDTTLVRVVPERSAITVALSKSDDRALVTYAGTIATLAASDIPSAALEGTRRLHIGSYFLQRTLQPDCAAILQRAQARGIATSLDPGDDPDDTWDAELARVLPHVDCFLPNEREATRIAGMESPAAALAALARRVPSVAIKLGVEGAVARVGGAEHRVSAYPVRAIDTTGAGDAFDAGFLWGVVRGLPPRECLRLGAATGALATTWPGGHDARLSPALVRDLIEATDGPGSFPLALQTEVNDGPDT
ncbi:MAG: carbohydrate kinase family protein [Thermomicrobiales bacterium]